MEKAKRKHSPEIAQKQITKILFLILALTILIFFFPLVWLDSPIKLHLQTYTLLPLLSVPLAIFYGSRFGLRKRDYLLLGFCLFMAILIFANFAPCELGCGGTLTKKTGIVIVDTHCSGTFFYCLF